MPDSTLPTPKIEFALTSGALDTPVWGDASSYLIPSDFSIRRGRQDETSPVQAGRATLTLDNRGRTFDPENPAWTSYIKPMRWVRISMVWAGITYILFTGHVETWRPTYSMRGEAICKVSCVDAFGTFFAKQTIGGESFSHPLSSQPMVITNDQYYPAFAGEDLIYRQIPQPIARKMTAGFDGQVDTPGGVYVTFNGTNTSNAGITETLVLTGTNPLLTTAATFKTVTRIGVAALSNSNVFVLGDIGQAVIIGMNNAFASEYSGAALTSLLTATAWPAADRSIQSGVSQIQAYTVKGGNVLSYAQQIADTEAGTIFISRDGKFTFINRHALLNRVSAATFGDGGGAELPYGEPFELDYGERYIFNSARGQRVGGLAQSAQDVTSSNAFFSREYPSRGQTLQTNDIEVADQVAFRIERYKNPNTRVAQMSPVGAKNPSAAWPVILGAELQQIHTITRRPGGAPITKIGVLENISYTMSGAANLQVTFGYSPATIGNYMVFDDPVLGQFNNNAFAY